MAMLENTATHLSQSFLAPGTIPSLKSANHNESCKLNSLSLKPRYFRHNHNPESIATPSNSMRNQAQPSINSLIITRINNPIIPHPIRFTTSCAIRPRDAHGLISQIRNPHSQAFSTTRAGEISPDTVLEIQIAAHVLHDVNFAYNCTDVISSYAHTVSWGI